MKKLLLLALMAGLVFGECRKHEIVDKMTDEKIISILCNDSSNGGAIVFQADKNGKPDLSPKRNDSEFPAYQITVITDSSIATETTMGAAKVGKLKIRVNKNKAYETQIALADSRSGFLFWLTKEQIEELKTAKTLLIQYYTIFEETKILEIDMSGFDKFL